MEILGTVLRTALVLVNLLGAHPSAQSSGDFQKCLDPAGDSDAVVTACSNFIQSPPKNGSDPPSPRDVAIAFFFRGLAYRHKGDPARAIQDYDQAIKIDPNYAAAYRWRAQSENDQRDFAAAIKDFTKAIDLDASYEAAYNGRGGVYDAEGDHDRAIQEYDQATRLDHTYAFPFYNRANIYQMRGEYDRAFTEYDRAVHLQPDFPAAFNGRGVVYDEKGDHDRAIQDFDEAIRLYPDYPGAFINRALAYLSKGDLDRAIKDLDQSLTLDPNNVYALYDRGVARFCAKSYEDAQKDFSAYLHIYPKSFNASLWLYLANARADERTAHRNLAAAVAGQDFGAWPGKLIALYLGAAAPEEVLWAARDPDPKQEKSQLCDAYFFLAEHTLLGSDPGNAKGLFEQALETGMTESTEYVAAGEELRQLTAQPKP